MFGRRYMHEYGATSEDFGRVPVVCRQNAATNPKAWFYGCPITLEQHQASPWIVESLPEMALVAQQLWDQAGIGPGDVQTAVLYDHFTPFILMQLEALGFCPLGEARHFIADVYIAFDGSIPINPARRPVG